MIQTDEYWCNNGDPVRWVGKTKQRKYARCPICGRRLLLKEVRDDWSGEVICYQIPPHKIRKTKRKKKRKL